MKILGNEPLTGETAEFSAKVKSLYIKFSLESISQLKKSIIVNKIGRQNGQFRSLCPALDRCLTRTGLGPHPKAELESGPVNLVSEH